MMNLISAPSGVRLKIKDIQGGHGVRRRLFTLGFHKEDIVELDSRSILRGPVVIKNITTDTSVAVGRGIAQKILVEKVGSK
ncbi:MAG: FeoA family protein [Candidatus Aminicenantaceae bacterium]